MAVTYASKQDLLDRDASFLWTVATDPNDSSQLDEVAIESALNDATEEINSFLTRYKLPLTSVPAILNRCCISMAFYWLGDRDANVSELMQKRYDQAMQTLREIQSGKRNLGLPEADKPNETTKGKAEVVAGYRPSMRQDLGNVL